MGVPTGSLLAVVGHKEDRLVTASAQGEAPAGPRSSPEDPLDDHAALRGSPWRPEQAPGPRAWTAFAVALSTCLPGRPNDRDHGIGDPGRVERVAGGRETEAEHGDVGVAQVDEIVERLRS